MGRPRKNDKHLPRYVRFKHGAYHFTNPKTGKCKKIGESIPEMYMNYAKLIHTFETSAETMNDLFDRYMLEVAPLKSASSYRVNKLQIGNLKEYFGEMNPLDVKPIYIYKYLDDRGQDAQVSANREFALLSHVFTVAIKWGAVESNPCIGLRKHSEPKRDREVTEEEFQAVRSIAEPHMQCIMDFAYYTGLRKGDILRIQLTDLHEDAIRININKVKKKAIIEWTEGISEIVKKCEQCRKALATKSAKKRKVLSIYLFPNKMGNKYTESGFTASWRRLIKKAMKGGLISQEFRFNDIRHKSATDAEHIHGREYARQLLAHTTQATTARYIDGAVRIKPLEKLSLIKK